MTFLALAKSFDENEAATHAFNHFESIAFASFASISADNAFIDEINTSVACRIFSPHDLSRCVANRSNSNNCSWKLRNRLLKTVASFEAWSNFCALS